MRAVSIGNKEKLSWVNLMHSNNLVHCLLFSQGSMSKKLPA